MSVKKDTSDDAKQKKQHFLLYGFGKAGSTFIFDYLRHHKNFSTPAIKEPYFFNLNFSKGMKWYLSLFEINEDTVGFGDFSNQNFRHNDTLINLKATFPKTKILILDRPPVDRLISARKFDLMNGSRQSIESFIQEWPEEFLFSDYLRASIEKVMPGSEILLVDFDDIVSDEDVALRNICDFIGIPFDSKKPDIQKNPSLVPRSEIFSGMAKQLAVLLRRAGFLRLLQLLKSSQLVRMMFHSEKKIHLSEEEMQKIGRYVRESSKF
jgi:hypothetical protein